jgi:hypothetical protein
MKLMGKIKNSNTGNWGKNVNKKVCFLNLADFEKFLLSKTKNVLIDEKKIPDFLYIKHQPLGIKYINLGTRTSFFCM